MHALDVTTDDSTFVEWYGDYDADDEVEAQLGEAFVGRYRKFCTDLATHFSTGVTSR